MGLPATDAEANALQIRVNKPVTILDGVLQVSQVICCVSLIQDFASRRCQRAWRSARSATRIAIGT